MHQKKKVSSKKEESESESEEDVKPKKDSPVKKAPIKSGSSLDDKDEADKKPKKEDENIDINLPPEVYEELFVRNLSFITTEESLANYFKKFGDVEAVRILTDKSTGKSRGIAFVKFYEKKSAYAAMQSSYNLNLDSRQLQIRYSNDISYKPSHQSERHSIFVGNLSFISNENSIKEYFSSCGNIVDIRLAKGDDGKLKGFAHVDFDSEEGVQKALKLNGKEYNGRQLKIDTCTPKQGRGGVGIMSTFGGNVNPFTKWSDYYSMEAK